MYTMRANDPIPVKWLLTSILLMVLTGFGCEKRNWEKAESENTIQAYQDFLENYPDGRYAEASRLKIEQINFKQAQGENTITGYEDFLKRYPKGHYAEKARSKIEGFYFEEAKAQNTILAYEAFLDRGYQGQLAELARQSIENFLSERQPLVKEVKIAKINVVQSFGKAKDFSLPFEEVVFLILRFAGIKILESDVEEADLTVKVRAKGRPLSSRYSANVTHYSGASLVGDFSFSVPGCPVIKKSFKGYIEPPFMIFKKFPKPSSAPFRSAYMQQGSFVPKFLNSAEDLFGINILIGALYHRDTRYIAVEKLGNLRDTRGIGPLIKVMNNEIIRPEVVDALLKIGKPVVEPLIAALKDENSQIRGNAAFALGEIKDTRAIMPLVVMLGDDLAGRNAGRALGIIGKSALEPLLAALVSRDSTARKNAAYGLGHLKESKALEPLIAALKDEGRLVRFRSAWALGEIGDKRAAEPLIQLLNDKNFYVRKEVVRALGKLKDKRTIEPLIELLKDKSSIIRGEAATALRKITGISRSYGEDYDKWKNWWQKY